MTYLSIYERVAGVRTETAPSGRFGSPNELRIE
jgi:hypothetical protein